MPGTFAPLAGFTLVELMIVMGLLSFFLLFLVEILRDSLSLWQQGEQRISLEGRGAAALDLLSRDIEQVQGVHGKSYKPGRKAKFRALSASKLGPARSGRLRVDWQAWLDHKTPAPAQAAFEIPLKLDWHQRLRMVCRLDAQETDRILRKQLRAKILKEEGQLGPAERENLVLQQIEAMAVRPLAEVCLRVLPEAAGDGSY
ncbi:MAG: PilW family protein, partial [Planctomycetota bacterium]